MVSTRSTLPLWSFSSIMKLSAGVEEGVEVFGFVAVIGRSRLLICCGLRMLEGAVLTTMHDPSVVVDELPEISKLVVFALFDGGLEILLIAKVVLSSRK